MANAFEKSRIYKLWSDATIFELTKCRRSDTQHFKFYTSLPENLYDATRLCRKEYKTAQDADLHIVLSHVRRRAINANKQEVFSKDKNYVEIPAGNDPGYNCCMGTKLIGSSTQGKIVNGGRYVVIEIGQNIKIKNLLSEEHFDMTRDSIGKYTQLGWAVVYQKVQGQTCEGTVLLHDLHSKFFNRAHLYVGLSRVTDGSKVFIARERFS